MTSFQLNVISLPSPGGVGFIDIMSPIGTALTASITTDPGVAAPGGIEFPFGFLDFTVSCLAPGASADITIAGLDLAEITDYFKYGTTPANPNSHWYNFLFGQQTDADSAIGTGMEIVNGNIVLHLVDGGRGDDDIVKNGVIFDIGGPAISQPNLLPGDYNLNSVVDTADYVLWRKTLSENVAPFSGADGDGSGIVDQADYGVWRAHFGQTLPPPAAGSEVSTFAAQAELVAPVAQAPCHTTRSSRSPRCRPSHTM